MKVSKIEWMAAAAMGVAMVTTSGEALAAGFMLREQSSEYLGNAFAGSAAKATSPATIWYNPAGMTLLHGHQIAGSLTWIAPQARFSGTSLVGGGPGGDAIDDAAVGSTFAMFDYSKDLKFGVALVSPFGLRTNYPANWAGRFQGVASAITNIAVNPNVAYRINENLSIGAGVTGSWVEADLSQATTTPFGLTRMKGDDYGFGWNVGAMWEFSKDTRIGVAYRSSIRNGLEGDMTSLSLGGVKLADIHADLTLPGTATVSLFHRIDDKWSVMADAQWTQWSVLRDLSVYNSAGALVASQKFDWRDTWFFSVGADYVWSKGHTLHVGAAYDMGAIKDAQHRGVRVPDVDRYWLSGGYTWDVNDKLRWNIAYAHLFAPQGDTVSTVGDGLTGKYDASVDIVSTSFVYKF